MGQCRYITNNGKQCERYVKKGNLCWQHSPVKRGHIVLAFLGGLAALTGLWWAIPNIFDRDIKPKLEEWAIIDIVCDRNKDSGCLINLNAHSSIAMTIASEISYEEISSIWFSFSENITESISTNILSKEGIYIPRYENEDIKIEDGPWKLSISDNNLIFSGKLHDLKTDEIIGWFDGNNFELLEHCSYSWNKDDYGIEIVDRYGFVVFSICYPFIDDETISSVLHFKGYFKLDGFYYIFNEKVYKTSDRNKAKSLIHKIEPIFDHSPNAKLGKRN